MAKKNEENATKNVAKAESERKKLGQLFKEQEKVSVNISPLYQPYFGKVMTVSINGIACAVPVDGKPYQVPAAFAAEVEARKFRQDELFKKMKNASKASDNFEKHPGDLELF